MNSSTGSNWAFSGSYRIFDHSFRVRTNVPRLGHLVGSFLKPFAASNGSRSPIYSLVRSERTQELTLRRGRERLTESTGTSAVLNRFLWEINQEAIRSASSYLLIHSAAASWRGKGILLPAAMDSGKTTLVAGLIRAGFDYLTDEAAAIDPVTGWLEPYPKALSVESPTLDVMPELKGRLQPEYPPTEHQFPLRPTDIRPRSVGKACPVRFIVFPKYSPTDGTSLEPLTPSDGLMALCQNAFNLERFKGDGLKALAEVVKGASCYRLKVADLQAAVALVQELVNDDRAGVAKRRRSSLP